MNIINLASTAVTSRTIGIGFILLACVMMFLSDLGWIGYNAGCYYTETNYVGAVALYGWLSTLAVGLNLMSSRIE